jgi:hypothetical protein
VPRWSSDQTSPLGPCDDVPSPFATPRLTGCSHGPAVPPPRGCMPVCPPCVVRSSCGDHLTLAMPNACWPCLAPRLSQWRQRLVTLPDDHAGGGACRPSDSVSDAVPRARVSRRASDGGQSRCAEGSLHGRCCDGSAAARALSSCAPRSSCCSRPRLLPTVLVLQLLALAPERLPIVAACRRLAALGLLRCCARSARCWRCARRLPARPSTQCCALSSCRRLKTRCRRTSAGV